VKGIAAACAMLALGLCVTTTSSRAASPAAPSTGAMPTAPAMAAPETEDGLAQQVSGWVLFGLGGASFVAGVVTGALALQTSSLLDQRCVQGQCAPAEHGQVDAFYALRTASTACFVASGPVLLGGIALLLTVPSADEPEAAAGTQADAATPMPGAHGSARGGQLALALGLGTIALGGAW
jgi:hypothetical protein